MSNKLGTQLKLLMLALSQLAEALEQPVNSFIRDSAIQRFEFSFELLWKTLKTYLEENEGLECRSPRESFRNAFQVGLIKNDAAWMESLRLRNLTSHTYNELIADEIFQELPSLLILYRSVLPEIQKRIA